MELGSQTKKKQQQKNETKNKQTPVDKGVSLIKSEDLFLGNVIYQYTYILLN